MNMSVARRNLLASATGSYLKHPIVAAAGATSLLSLLGLNLLAFIVGASAPLLLAAVVIADVVVVGASAFVSTREVLMAEYRSEVSEARLASIMDSAMDRAALNLILDSEERQNFIIAFCLSISCNSHACLPRSRIVSRMLKIIC